MPSSIRHRTMPALVVASTLSAAMPPTALAAAQPRAARADSAVTRYRSSHSHFALKDASTPGTNVPRLHDARQRSH